MSDHKLVAHYDVVWTAGKGREDVKQLDIAEVLWQSTGDAAATDRATRSGASSSQATGTLRPSSVYADARPVAVRSS